MAGLLDGLGGLSGDDTVKDQFGQTQADRRDPLWAGLIRAGLLGVAGGSNIMPEQRAAYLAQAGGAIADIPNQMLANKSAAAQQMLRGQQLDEGKRKIADRDRIRAMMQNPEMAQIVANAKGADKIAIQAAIETGDIGALNTAIGNLDKSGINAQKLDNATERLKLAQDAAAQKAGRYKGTNERLQHLDNLKHEDPNTFEYWAAWDFLTKDQKAPDGSIVPKTDLEAAGFKPPTYVPGGGKPPPKPGQLDIDSEIAQWSKYGTPEQPPPPQKTIDDYIKIGQGLTAGGPPTTVDGITIRKNSLGDVEVEPPDAPMIRVPAGTSEKRSVPQQQLPAPVLAQLQQQETALARMDNLETELKKAGIQVGNFANFFTPTSILNRADPEGVKARATITALASELIHALSGGAVTPQEFQRLEGRVPTATDTPETIKVKLEDLREAALRVGRTQLQSLGPGYRVAPEFRKRFGGGGKPAAPAGGPKGTTPIGKGDKGQDIYQWSDGTMREGPEP